MHILKTFIRKTTIPPGLIAILFSILLLAGCSATSVFRPYPDRVAPLRNDIQTGRLTDPDDLYKREVKGNDAVLYLMERGRAEQLIGEAAESLRDFDKSLDRLKEFDERAVISARSVGAQAASLTLNDNAVPYRPPYFERAMLRYLQAQNRLLAGQAGEALVDLRWAAEDQQAAFTKNEPATTVDLTLVRERYAGLDEAAGRIKSSYQNPAVYYLSGLAYEAAGQANDAYIDYKKALELVPANHFLQSEVLRLSERLGMTDDLDELRRRFAPLRNSPSCGVDQGTLVILFEDNLLPAKIPVDLVLPIPGSGLIRVSLPTYPAIRSHFSFAEATTGAGGHLGRLEPLADLTGLAQRSLLEELPLVATRQILRAIAKATAAHKTRERTGPLGELLFSLYNLVSEQADLRSWSTLPATIENLRSCLPPGRRTIRLQTDNWQYQTEIDVKPGFLTILFVTRAGSATYTRSALLPLPRT